MVHQMYHPSTPMRRQENNILEGVDMSLRGDTIWYFPIHCNMGRLQKIILMSYYVEAPH